MSRIFQELPLWLSIPYAIIYLGVVGYMLFTMYRYSDWRERRITKKKQQHNNNSSRS